jgi:transposase InsO family protein
MSIEDPADLWDAVKRDYVEELQRGQYYVRNDLTALKLEDCGSVDAYVAKIQDLLDQYKLGSEDNDSIGVKEHVFYLVHGIPEGGDWDVELRLIQNKLPTEGWNKEPAKISKMLQNREAELRKIKGISSDVLLYTKAATTKKTTKGKVDSKKEKVKPVCTHCKKEGHLQEKCWTKHGKPPVKGDTKASQNDKKGTSNTANIATASTTATTGTLWMTLANPGPELFVDSAVDADKVYRSWTQIDTSRDIFLDSACTRHVINRKDLFVSYLPLKEGVGEVQGFNQSRAYAKGVGTVRVSMRVPSGIRWVTLQNVLHVEESANLVSQGRLMRRGLHLDVNGYGANVYTPNGELTACAPLVGLMLTFDVAWDALEGDTVTNQETANTTIVHSFKTTAREVRAGGAELKLWHRRYAHLGLEALKRLPTAVTGMSESASLGGAYDCKACIKGKHARLSFHPVNKRATERLELVQADICGPFSESLDSKGRYILLFIDDATRYTWCYILERKSDAETNFREWKAEMFTQYDLKVKRFRTDGGGEFTSKRFLRYLRELGVRKETTAPYSPQSNGVVERANRTIVERVRSMLEDALAPMRYIFTIQYDRTGSHPAPT